jgi:hypothetical protein
LGREPFEVFNGIHIEGDTWRFDNLAGNTDALRNPLMPSRLGPPNCEGISAEARKRCAAPFLAWHQHHSALFTE